MSYGLAAELSDPDGWVWTMLTAMDGTRGTAEIVEYVRAEHPDQPDSVLLRGAEQMLASGYVEDVAGRFRPALQNGTWTGTTGRSDISGGWT